MKLLGLFSALILVAPFGVADEEKPIFTDYFMTELPRDSGQARGDKILITKKSFGGYEWFFLTVNGKSIKPDEAYGAGAMDLYELVERDWRNIHPPLDEAKKQQLCVKITEFLIKAAPGTSPNEKLKSFETFSVQKGRNSGYFSCEKSSYVTLGIKYYRNAHIIEALHPK